MEHGIVALTQGIAVGACLTGNTLPLLWSHVSRYVHCTAIADNEHWLAAHTGEPHKMILKGKLSLEDGTLALKI